MNPDNIVIVGAGPAGISAAATLVAHGCRPVVIDEAPQAGGQIYRQQPGAFRRTPTELYGADAKSAISAHKCWQTIQPDLDYFPQHLVWNANSTELNLLDQQRQQFLTLPWQSLILTGGATDRILPFPGWTLPGVYSLGGAQVALKYQGCAIGKQVVIAGNGPLLYLLAWQYLKAGIHIAAILDSGSLADKIKASAAMAHAPSVLLKGLGFLARLKLKGVPVYTRSRLLQACGSGQVESLRWCYSHHPEQIIETPCDAIAFGYGLRPETQLAELLGCEMTYSETARTWLPILNQGQSSHAQIFIAGDSAGIAGAPAARLRGEQAALRLLQQRHIAIDEKRMEAIGKQLHHLDIFASGLTTAFPFPENWLDSLTDDTIICRCEHITVGEIRRTIAETGTMEVNQLKALSRTGMGRCQGRMCGTAVTELLASIQKIPGQDAGHFRSQHPVKPIPVLTLSDKAIQTISTANTVMKNQEVIPYENI